MAEKKNEIARTNVTTDVLVEKFKYVASKIPILDKASAIVKVESDDQLAIAENNAKEVHGYLKEVDNTRKILKAPAAEEVKLIDGYCKTITDALERIKLRFSSEITNYKVLKEAQLKAEREVKLREIEKAEAEKTDESQKIVRIQRQLYARIYGGVYHKKDGTPVTVSGCLTRQDCDDLGKWIGTNAPKKESFVHFSAAFEDMMREIARRLANHSIDMIDLHNPNDAIAREGAMRRMAEARAEAMKDSLDTSEKIENVIEKESKKEMTIIARDISNAGKGVRETLRYTITDEVAVPRDMFSVDHDKVKAYMNANKEKIKEALTRGEEILPGIKFYVDNSYITRES